MTNGIKNKIVTGVYELNYSQIRGGGIYKGIDLLTKTIRNIIFDGYEYVIYTNKSSYEKFDLGNLFKGNNIKIKFVELNGDYYNNYLNPIRLRRLEEGEIWDRIHSVDNYVEVMYKKFDFLIEESKDFDGNVVWIDAGLFGTSCSNAWRDYMNEICHTENFLKKLFEKIDEHNSIALKGDYIVMNYEMREKINNALNINSFIVPGGLFGGTSKSILENYVNYKNIVKKIVDSCDDFTSDQEVLCSLLVNTNTKFFEFNDWDDLQKGILKIMDLYDESLYQTNSILNYKNPSKKLEEIEYSNFTELADLLGIDKGSLHENHRYTEVYEEYLKKYLNKNPVIVEIGINDTRFPGGCLKFWDLIFKEMDYYGFDITDCSHLDFNRNKIKVFQGDQNNKNNLLEFVYKFDLSDRVDFIIDDGSHISEHIVTTFKILFPHLKKGGLYFVEDLHASQAEREKTLNEIKFFLEKESEPIDSWVLTSNNKLLIIKK